MYKIKKFFPKTIPLTLTCFFGFSAFTELSSQSFSKENNSSITNSLTTEYLKFKSEEDYILGSGDTVLISVSRDYPELQSVVTIDGEGTIYLPKIHRIYVKGLSIDELNNLLDKAFSKFVKYPKLESKIITYRPIRVFVDGEVENPGLQTLLGALKVPFNPNKVSKEAEKTEIELIPSLGLNQDLKQKIKPFNQISPQELFEMEDNIANDLERQNKFLRTSIQSGENYYFPTIFDVIREAGGVTLLSDLENIEVIRKNSLSNGGGLKKTEIDFSSILTLGDSSNNIRVYDGDRIYIKKLDKPNDSLLLRAIKSNLNPRFINVSVNGRVRKPGIVTAIKSSTLNDAINLAGGARILKGKVNFIRFNNDGTLDSRKIRYGKNKMRGSYSNPNLRNGDFIYVGDSFLSASSEVINEISAPFTGIFSTYGLIKAISE